MTEPPDLECVKAALRQLIGWRDRLAVELARLDADIAAEARLYANLTGLTVKPSVEQLRRALNERESP